MSKKILVFIFIFSLSFLFSYEDLNSSRLFSQPGYSEDLVFFSVTNPIFTGEDSDEKLIFSAAKEISKFISIDLGYFSSAYPMGSFFINNSKIYVDYDTDRIESILKYIKPVLTERVGSIDISAVKIKKSDLITLWSVYNNAECPDYAEIISFVNANYPLWYEDMPKKDGYIFGIGVSDEISSVYGNVEKADYNSMVDIINTINIKVTVDSYHVESGCLELYYMFSQQRSSASVSGIKVIKRYYSSSMKTAFSLAVMKINKN